MSVGGRREGTDAAKSPTVPQLYRSVLCACDPVLRFYRRLQTAGFADGHAGVAPPRWISAIANLHKHQTIGGHKRTGGPEGGKPKGAGAPRGGGGGDHDEGGFVAEKPFVVLLALALFVTTALGLVIAVATPSTRRISLVLIAAGILVPLVLLL